MTTCRCLRPTRGSGTRSRPISAAGCFPPHSEEPQGRYLRLPLHLVLARPSRPSEPDQHRALQGQEYPARRPCRQPDPQGHLTQRLRHHIPPDRQWVPLSEQREDPLHHDQDPGLILLIDVGGTLVMNLNDAGTCGWGRAVRAEVARFAKDCYLLLSVRLRRRGHIQLPRRVGRASSRLPRRAKTPFGAGIANRGESRRRARSSSRSARCTSTSATDSVWANELHHADRGLTERASRASLRDHARLHPLSTPRAARIEELRPRGAGREHVARPATTSATTGPSQLERRRKARQVREPISPASRHLRRSARLRERASVGGRDQKIELSRGPLAARGVSFEVPRG